MADPMWQTIHVERRALADDLRGLDPAQWATPSWCTDWTVQDTLGHLTSTATMTPLRFILGFARAGFRFPSFSAAGMARYRGASPAEALANFVAHQDDSTSPPGPKTSWLGEILVHSQDIRGALGIAHTSPVDAARDVAQFYAGSNALIGAKDRVAGLTLRATDTEWSHGSGPEVSGPVMSLVMAMTGRAPALEALSGPGVDSLRARCG